MRVDRSDSIDGREGKEGRDGRLIDSGSSREGNARRQLSLL